MNKRYGALARCSLLAVISAALLILAACAARTPAGNIDRGQSDTTVSPREAAPATPPSAPPADVSVPEEPDYLDRLVQETVAQFALPGMGEYDKAKAAFDYMVENTTLLDPVGLELWRIRGNSTGPLSFVENRSLSVLLFRLGKCEDYAAALTLLLRGMGLEAEYVPGLTYSTQGALVDHAWTIAKIDGVWYHLDCQLEQNISRHGSIRYKYFLRGDMTMRESHRWGQNLIDSRLLATAQNDEIARNHVPPACPQDFPTPGRRSCTLPDAPDRAAIEALIAEELAEYERANGPLEPLELNIIPPVFALEGYGPQD